MYSNFVFLDQFLFELSCKNTQTQTHTHTHEYSIVAFSKNATIIIFKSPNIHSPTREKVATSNHYNLTGNLCEKNFDHEEKPDGILDLNYIGPTSKFYIGPTLTCTLCRHL